MSRWTLLTLFVSVFLTSCNPLLSNPLVDSSFFTHSLQPTPAVKSIELTSTNPTQSATLGFHVEFNTPVTGVKPSNFRIVSTGGLNGVITALSGQGAEYDVTVTTPLGNGSVRLDLSSGDGIQSASSVAVSDSYTSGPSYTVYGLPPAAPSSLALGTPSSSPSNVNTPVIQVGGLSSAVQEISLFSNSGCTGLPLIRVSSSGSGTAAVGLPALSDGVHTFFAQAHNLAGSSSCSTASVAFTLDTIPVSVTGLSDDSTAHLSKSWTWGCSKSSCSYRYYMDTSSVWTPTGSFSSSSNGSLSSGEGTYFLHVQAKDLAGNLSAVVTVSTQLYKVLTIDTAVIPETGKSVVITMNALPASPLLPALGVTGFSVKVNGSAAAITGASRTAAKEITLQLKLPVSQADTVTLSYTSGNLTDSATSPHGLDTYVDEAIENHSTWDEDAAIYFKRVTSNMGTLTDSTLDAIQALVSQLKTDGVWSKLIEIYPFAGGSLAAMLTKLKAKTGGSSYLTNSNFVDADYSETGTSGGLRGNGVKYLDTGVSVPALATNSISMGAYIRLDSSSAVIGGSIIGSSYTATGDYDRFYMLGYGSNSSLIGQTGLGSMSTAGLVDGIGFRAMSYDGTYLNSYKNTVQVSQSTGALHWQQPGTVMIFRAAGLFHDGMISFAFVGVHLTATEMAKLYSAVQAFQAALSREI